MRLYVTLLLGTAALSKCTREEPPPTPLKATIQRTAHGVPHITAEDYRSLGAGIGHVQAEDLVCTLADQFLKVRGERARYFGRGPEGANVESDLTYRGLALRARAEAAYARQSPELRELVEGFAAGYNHYLEQTPPERLPAPCRGASWVKPITHADLLAYHLDISLLDTLAPLLGYVANAQPPGEASTAKWSPLPQGGLGQLRETSLGSNGWALGRERSTGRGGMLVANPHFPWEGALRFYESHLTIPGRLDVYGASLVGLPVINIGFNRHVAWTHTVTASSHFTAYRLRLVEGDPTAYHYDGQVRRMTREEHTIDVLEADGRLSQVKRTFWRSHYGPMLKRPEVPWTSAVAYTLRDANEDNHQFAEQWLRMNKARSLDELVEVDRTVRGIPWVNTLMASADGDTRYADASRAPHLSEETLAAYHAARETEPDTQRFASLKVILLDGSKSRDEWVGVEGPSRGLVPVDKAPRLSRADFVMNANDSARYTNPAELLQNVPFPYEVYASPQGRLSNRSRGNLMLLTEQGADSASGADGTFTREELERAILSNRDWLAEQLLVPIARRCQGATTVSVKDTQVDLTEACRALAAWDGRLEVDRSGAIVWREFLARFTRADLNDKGVLFADPFDPRRPVSTPTGLVPAPASGPDPLLQKLGEAVLVLREAGIPVGARLGDVQFTRKGDQVIPIHGGVNGVEGVANVVGFSSVNTTLLPRTPRGKVLSENTGLTSEGYLVNNGASFLLVMEFTKAGPRASALLAYSGSTDPASTHFADQTRLFSKKQLRPVLFERKDILADPELNTTQLVVPEMAP
ncbi:penicillin acylase family protein [Corallococcus terminator]